MKSVDSYSGPGGECKSGLPRAQMAGPGTCREEHGQAMGGGVK